VLLNQGNGTFANKADYAIDISTQSLALGDLNGDGKFDLVVTSLGYDDGAGNVSVLLNQGDGTFGTKVDYATRFKFDPDSVAIGDVDGDGKPDVVAAVYMTMSVWLNKGNGVLAKRVDYWGGPGVSVVLGDFNGDGNLDVATANCFAETVSVFLNLGDGTFGAAVDYSTGTGSRPQSLAVGDLNGDGSLDLAVANSKVDYAAGDSPVSVAVADVNGDGNPDIVFADIDGSAAGVLLNNGDGTFAVAVEYPSGVQPTSVAVGDVNGDGRPDLIVANGHDNTVSVLFNDCR
jgi:hypothetical protein